MNKNVNYKELYLAAEAREEIALDGWNNEKEKNVVANRLYHKYKDMFAAAEARRKELEEENLELTNGPRCADCLDTGLLNNRVEGDYLCTCITETDAYEKFIAPQEARIKELELAISGKTFSYDPDSYQKGFIAGMEKAAEILAEIINYEPARPELTIPNDDCPDCARARARNWPPSNLCEVHYRYLSQHEKKLREIDVYRYYELKKIARDGLSRIEEVKNAKP